MAFRINYRGALIEADTAQDVRELVLVLAAQLPRQLTAGVPAGAEEVPARSARRRRGRRVGGGVRRHGGRRRTPAAGRGRRPGRPGAVAAGETSDQVLAAIRAGFAKRGEIARRVKVTASALASALRQLVEGGQVRADGATSGRRYLPVEGARARQAAAVAAKEGL